MSVIRNVVDRDYEGSSTAIVDALRSLDIATTPVGALGGCLTQALSSSPVGQQREQPPQQGLAMNAAPSIEVPAVGVALLVEGCGGAQPLSSSSGGGGWGGGERGPTTKQG